jgi:hypothetical protein
MQWVTHHSTLSFDCVAQKIAALIMALRRSPEKTRLGDRDNPDTEFQGISFFKKT